MTTTNTRPVPYRKRRSLVSVTGRRRSPRPFDATAKERFLEHLECTGQVLESAFAAGVSDATVRNHRKRDTDFAEAYATALERFRESLQAEAYRRGVVGWDEPVFQNGEEVGVIRRYSDRLLELLLKRHIPEFRQRVSIERNTTSGVLFIAPVVESTGKCVAKAPEVTAEASLAAAERGTGNGSGHAR